MISARNGVKQLSNDPWILLLMSFLDYSKIYTIVNLTAAYVYIMSRVTEYLPDHKRRTVSRLVHGSEDAITVYHMVENTWVFLL